MIYTSSNCKKAERIEKALQGLISAGIKNIELNSAGKHIPDITGFLQAFKKEHGLNFLVHNYFPAPEADFVLNPASQNKIILNKTIECCKTSIRLAADLSSSIYSVHAGMRCDPVSTELSRAITQLYTAPYNDAYNTFVRSLTTLCDYALEFNLEIAVENHVLAPFNLKNGKNELLLMCRHEELLKLFEDVNRPNLKVLVDVGHLKVTAATLSFDAGSFIEALKGKIAIFHLSDNNGFEDTHEIIRDDSWFWGALQHFQDAVFVIESHGLTASQIRSTQRLCRERLSFKEAAYR